MLIGLWIKPVLKFIKTKQNFLPNKLEKYNWYELPGLGLAIYAFYIVVWRSFRVPTNVRDVLSGPEPISAFAIKEKTLINSIFELDLFSTNNQFKSPFLTDLQIIYKMAGLEFGGLWIALLAIGFTLFLYCVLKEKIHALLASIAIFLFYSAPEVFAYSFLYLFDYPNMVLWTVGTYAMYKISMQKNNSYFALATISFAFATYIRAETLILLCMMMPLFVVISKCNKLDWKYIITVAITIPFIGFIAYYIPTQLYNNHYLPQDYVIETLINNDLTNLDPLWTRFEQMTNKYLLGSYAENFWMYNIKIFIGLFVIEILYLLVTKKFKDTAWWYWLGASLVIYIGLPLMGFLMPLMDMDHSTKRALFKLMPLLFIFISHFKWIQWLSDKLYSWEYYLPNNNANQPKIKTPKVNPQVVTVKKQTKVTTTKKKKK